ncbi:MAG: NAD(P)H-binding protein [Polyangiaceae bacterium]|nr:NAD(P)H-binding protein [Polyangiaceae bacterium]
MITVFGPTGNTGSVAASTLLDRGVQVRVVARDPAKVEHLAKRGAEVFRGDVLDAGSVSAALAGADGAYLIMPPDPTATDLVGRNLTIAQHFAAALTQHRTKHAVLLSSVGAQEPAGTGPIVSTYNAEKVLLSSASGTRFTFVRAAYFMENILANVHPMKGDGVLPVFGGGEQYPFAMIATRDIGLLAADTLAAPPLENGVIELSGPMEYSFNDAARIAGNILGREVKAVAVPLEAMVPTLTGFGFSANVAGLYREMTEGFAKGAIKFDGKGRAVRGKTTLEEVLRPALAA